MKTLTFVIVIILTSACGNIIKGCQTLDGTIYYPFNRQCPFEYKYQVPPEYIIEEGE